MVAPSGVRASGEGSANGSTARELPPGAREGRGFSAHAAEIATLLARLGRIQVARGRVRVQHAIFLALGALAFLLVTAAASLSGVRLFVRGLAAGLTQACGGRVWLGELVSGVVLLGGTLLLFLALRAWSERRVLRELGDSHGTKHGQP